MDVKVETGGRGRRSRVIPVKYRVRCDPTVLDERQSPDQPPEPPDWPTDENSFLAYTQKERDEITAALDRVGAQYEVVPEEPEVYHIVCNLEAAAAAGTEHQSWSRSEAGFVAPIAAERDRIEAALTRAHVPYTVNIRAPDQDFLRRLEGRVATRSAALAAMATGTLPPVLGDITEISARLDELAAAEAMIPEERRGRVSRSEKVSAGVLIAGAIACFAPGIGHLGEGRAGPGWALLAGASLLVTIGLFLLPNLRTKWRWCGLPIALSLVAGGVIILFGILGSNTTVVPALPSGIPRERQGTDAAAAPSRTGTEGSANTLEPQRAESDAKAPLREEQQPPAPAEAPLVGDGATVIQETTGDSSHNIIARDVTINQERNPNAPIETYDFHGAKRISEPGKTKVTPGDQYAAFCETLSPLHQAQEWKRLAEACETQIQVAPDWLTPYLYAGEAYMHLGEREKAIERLEYVEQESAGREDYAEAKRLLEQLHETQTDHVSSRTPMVR